MRKDKQKIGGKRRYEKTIRVTLDIAMPVLMLLLMAYTLVGKAAHEWIGIALLVVMICHNLLNRAWHKNLFRSRFAALKRQCSNFSVSATSVTKSEILRFSEPEAVAPVPVGKPAT